jgi:hypothetical protein
VFPFVFIRQKSTSFHLFLHIHSLPIWMYMWHNLYSSTQVASLDLKSNLGEVFYVMELCTHPQSWSRQQVNDVETADMKAIIEKACVAT